MAHMASQEGPLRGSPDNCHHALCSRVLVVSHADPKSLCQSHCTLRGDFLGRLGGIAAHVPTFHANPQGTLAPGRCYSSLFI